MKTSISWTDYSWNPIRARRKDTGKTGWHCEKIAPECKHCYAETFNNRLLPGGGTGLDYTVPNREKVEIYLDEKTLEQPLHWRKPRKIFVCSMTDLFAEFVDYRFALEMWYVFIKSPQHIFLILTKRPRRMFGFFEWVTRTWPDISFPTLKNVHLGVSAGTQDTLDKFVPWLLRTPAAHRWVSVEPLLEAVNLQHCLGDCLCDWCGGSNRSLGRYAVDSIVVGGESGPHSRPCDIDWIRSVVRQCKEAGTPCHIKQLGSKPIQQAFWHRPPMLDFQELKLHDRKGSDPAEWPIDLQETRTP